jgi:hypothetical protein
VPGIPSLALALDAPERQVDIVMHNQQLLPRLDIASHQRGNRLTTGIHIGLRLCQYYRTLPNTPYTTDSRYFFALYGNPKTTGEHIDDIKADIVQATLVTSSRIP